MASVQYTQYDTGVAVSDGISYCCRSRCQGDRLVRPAGVSSRNPDNEARDRHIPRERGQYDFHNADAAMMMIAE